MAAPSATVASVQRLAGAPLIFGCNVAGDSALDADFAAWSAGHK